MPYLSLIAAIGLSPLTHLKIADVAHRKLSSAMREPIEHIVSNALGAPAGCLELLCRA